MFLYLLIIVSTYFGLSYWPFSGNSLVLRVLSLYVKLCSKFAAAAAAPAAAAAAAAAVLLVT